MERAAAAVAEGPQFEACEFRAIPCVFAGEPWFRCFEENDMSIGWKFLKGHCLLCNEGNVRNCRCFPEDNSNLRDGEGMLPCLDVGNCPVCKSAGTVGYACRECNQEVYKRFVRNGARAHPVEWAEAEDKGIFLIVPPSPIPNPRTDLDVEWSAADQEAQERRQEKLARSMDRAMFEVAQLMAKRAAGGTGR